MLISGFTLLAALAVPLMAGSFVISLGDPAASKDPAARGAIATVQLSTHVGPADNHQLEVTAEGLVGAKRVSMPVKVVKLQNSTLSAIHWTKPAEGTWVLRFKIGANRYAQAPVGADGVRPQVHPMAWSDADNTDMVLAALVSKITIAQREETSVR
jgi:hypothetical protein